MTVKSSTRKIALCVVAGVVLVGSARAAPVGVSPAAERFTLGQFQGYVLRDALNVVPNDGKVFGVDAGAAKVAAVLKGGGAPTDKVTLGVDALLIETPDRLVLLDSGLGPKAGGALMRSLALTGKRPDAVTDILITHGHGDHIGGLLTADGKPAFPKATIHMAAQEWSWIQSQPANQPYVDALSGAVKTFEPGDVVIPGFRAIAIAGHTPGHVGYEITSGKAKLLDIGDTAHSALISLAHPEWSNGYDTDAALARTSREGEFAQLAASHERIFAPHFPFPSLGVIVKVGKAYAWRPAPLRQKPTA